MTREFVTYDQAVALKELGFDTPCLAKHDLNHILLRVEECKSQENAQELDYILAPLYQQAFRWFREKHKINSGIVPHYDYFYFIIKNFGSGEEYYSDDMIELTYEEAESACLDKLIEITKNK